MAKSNKAQGMSVNVIIIAALALIVFVVLAVLFTGKTKNFSQTIESCSSKGGQCLSKEQCGDQPKISNVKDCTTNQVCCIKVLS